MTQLDWLRLHPDLFAAIRAAKSIADPGARLTEAARLAGFQRDFVAAGRIDRLAEDGLNPAGRALPAGLTGLRLAVLASHTVDHLLPSIRVAGLQRRLAMSVYSAPYGQYRQDILDGSSNLAAFAPQVVLLALDGHDTPLDVRIDASERAVAAAVEARADDIRRLWRRARERFGAQVVQQLLLTATPPLFGNFERLVPAAPAAITARLNAALVGAAREDGVLLLDLASHPAALQADGGLGDPARWHQAKQLVSPLAAPLYGDLVARVAAATVGLSRKVLVLDLDNTLWGGVIGDDGLDGIALGSGTSSGEAYQAFQHYAAMLARRGIVLAVCSKNDAAVAERAFSDHPEMVLRRTDISAFAANWTDKATNLRQIARDLNLGLDSMVFVDDNPAERAIVRRELPEVAVPELPDDVANYPARIAAAGYFETVSFTGDDATRGRSYALNSARAASLEQATDMESYLQDLQMELTVLPIGAAELPRSGQLINKTNQFNLTTRRFTATELEAFVAAKGNVSLAFRLKDRFGDNGLISVVLARPDPALADDQLLIDTWLMSCRVLGRQVEAAVLAALVEHAAARGTRLLIGQYRPTSRNGMVSKHYAMLGFRGVALVPGRLADTPADATFWQFDIGRDSMPPHHIGRAVTE